MNVRHLTLPLASMMILLSACASGNYNGSGQQSFAEREPGQNYCPDRLPMAQDRITQLYERAYNQPAQRQHTTVVRDAWGNEFRSTVVTQSQQPIRMQDAQTGLSDLVLNCGASFSGRNCFVTMFLDGEEIADIGPTTEGRVAFQCLLAGRHNLRITSPGGGVVYDGVINLKSDHEHVVEIMEDTGFRQYAANYIQGRVPAVPVNYSRVRTHEVQTGPVRTTRTTTGPVSTTRTTTGPVSTTRRPVTTRTTTTRTTTRRRTTSARRERVASALTPREFTSLLRSVKSQRASSDRVHLIRSTSKASYYTSDQVRRLVRTLSTSSHRQNIAVELHPRVVDPQNFHAVYRAFKFTSEKREVNRRLGLNHR